MNINTSGPKILWEFDLFGLTVTITETVVSGALVFLLLAIGSYFLGRNLKKRPGGRQVLVEKVVTMLYNMVGDTMGKHNLRFAPYIGTLFCSSLFGSLIGMTGFFRSTTSDLSTTLTWALVTSVLVWYHNIKNNGFLGWLKGFTEPVVVMTPMNIVSEIAQPVSMAFRHFGNVAGGGVITMILYTALSMASALVIRLVSGTVVIPIVVMLLGGVLLAMGIKKQKLGRKIIGIAFLVIGLLGILEYTGILTGVPILQFGIPAVLSIYFDLFSGFVQAFVFSLLNMVYIAGACPAPEEAAAEA